MDIYKNKKVFLSGHSGFKGTWLYLLLKNIGSDIFGYSLPPMTNPNHFDLLSKTCCFNGVFADVRDRYSLQNALLDSNPHIIFHLAAQPLVREGYKNPIETFEINSMGILNLLYAVHTLKNRLTNLKAILIVTTDKVYKNKERIWSYRENDRLGGYDPYSASKTCGEIIVDSMRESFFNVDDFGKSHHILIATLRSGNVIGGGDFSADRLIPDVMYGVMHNKPAIIRNPFAIRPWQNVLEPLRGYLMLGARLLNGECEFASSFNFGPDASGNIRVIDVLNIAKNIWNKIEFTIQENTSNPREANSLMLDISKSYHLLGWRPLLNIMDSIKHTIVWYKEFIENKNILTQKQVAKYLHDLEGLENRF